VKLIADVNISPRVVEHLRAGGFDAVRITELLDARSTDEAVLAEAARQGAVLISRDQDFSAIVALSGATRPSLLNIRMSSVDPKVIADAVMLVLRTAHDELSAGAVATLDDVGVRVHQLPIR
jgi:predicted nuclease of predicted toxin-antitoxin system